MEDEQNAHDPRFAFERDAEKARLGHVARQHIKRHRMWRVARQCIGCDAWEGAKQRTRGCGAMREITERKAVPAPDRGVAHPRLCGAVYDCHLMSLVERYAGADVAPARRGGPALALRPTALIPCRTRHNDCQRSLAKPQTTAFHCSQTRVLRVIKPYFALRLLHQMT